MMLSKISSVDVSAFSYAVVHVVLVSANEQMVGIYAGTAVAAVTDEHSFGDFASVQQPRHSLSAYGKAIE